MQNPDDRRLQPLDGEPTLQPPVSPDVSSRSQDSHTSSELPPWFSGLPMANDARASQLTARKPKKKSLLITLIFLASLMVLGGGSVFAYNYWYQNPEKVVTDGLVNAMKAQSIAYLGSYAMTGSQNLKLEVAGKSDGAVNDLNAKISFRLGDKDFVIDGDTLFDKNGDSYVRIKNVKEIAAKLRVALGDSEESHKLLDAIVAKVNNRWVKTGGSELNQLTLNAIGTNGQKCFSQAADKIRNDESTISELVDAYKKHKFIIIDEKLGEQNGNLGYVLSTDEKIQEAFTVEFKKTRLYKTLVECDDSYKINDDLPSEEQELSVPVITKTKLWISRWSHEITKFDFEMNIGDDLKHAIVLEPTFNQVKGPIRTPDDSVTLKQLQAELSELYQAAMPSAPSSYNEGASSEL